MNKVRKNVREAALELLETVEKNQSYSNLMLNSYIEKYGFAGPDAGLLTEIAYGTLQRKQTLDFFLAPFLRKKIETWVRILLRLSLYQMVYLDKIPDRAIIFEAVEIAKKRGHQGISGMVNGVLRAMQRKGLPSFKEIEDPIERLSVATSHPRWLVERWLEEYGYKTTKEMCEANLAPPVQTARVNVNKASVEEVVDRLGREGFKIEPSPVIPEAVRSLKGNLARSVCFKEGLITIQDESSMAVAYALDIQKGQHILDCCAAPGGKTTHIAEKLGGTGKVTALDLHPHKIKLIRENAERLGLSQIEAVVMDSREAGQHFEKESFDRILVDAPCSGLGVVRRKPDIKYVKNIKDMKTLQHVQLSILEEMAGLLKPDGIMVFSTCTVDRAENEGTIETFLKQHPGFEPYPLHVPEAMENYVDGYRTQIFPQDFGGDGFFIASVRKKEME
ncbi:ribosomal RNA small subunit methyltransferase B [Weizmannia acidilactici]|uniref:16S rRNA (cytosine(967)-C(5))-methyltransferase n=1 Tax=Weizmannia acidilactici TaxID=2607726 RepID=A0A5J4JED3_9BACI|nr:16S rRNA (cytosine(967)-C(5))-methyltransferase RsmB [Weizmannia acidilactici]GER70413.1 ribosomal RNA small subunit methyltransferase B [Weizmannia acidilactici]